MEVGNCYKRKPQQSPSMWWRGADCRKRGGWRVVRRRQRQHTELSPTQQVIPGSSLHVPQGLDRRAATGGFHTPLYILCVCVSPSAEVCTESQKAALLLSARNVRPGASTSTKVLQKQYNLCLRVNNANQSRLSGYRLPSHLSLVKHTLSLSVLTAPTWNLTLCIHVYMRCVAWLK